MAFRPEANVTGVRFQDCQGGYVGRITGLPIYQNEGRHLMHIGASYTWRQPNQDFQDVSGTVAGNPDPTKPPTGGTVRFRARQEQFDNAGDETHPNGNSNRLVDTGAISARAQDAFGFETLVVMGPLSLQAEYAFAHMCDAVIAGKRYDWLGFEGGYIQ